MTKQRCDLDFLGKMLTDLVADFPVAVETDSMNDWAQAVGQLAEYMAERHREMHDD